MTEGTVTAGSGELSAPGEQSRPSASPSRRARLLRTRLGKPMFGIGGQFLNAGTNVVTAYAASVLLLPEVFGSFVLAFACVTMVLAAGRGLLGSTIVVHLPAQEPSARTGLVRSALGFTALLGLAVSVLLVPFGGVLLWFAPWITFALLQDLARYALLAEGRVAAAFALDLAWALAQGVVIAAWLLLGGAMSVGLLATAWGTGALAGFALFVVMTRARLAMPGPWVRATRDVAGWFTAVALLGAVELYAVLQIATAMLGPADAGGVRAIQLLAFQPALVVSGALLVLLTPATVHAKDSRAALARTSRRTALAVAPLVVAIGLVAVLRRPLTALLFGQYTAFAPLTIPIALQAIFVTMTLPAIVVLRALRRGPTVLVVGVFRLVLLSAAAVAGAALGGAIGLAWALAGAMFLAMLQAGGSALLTTRRTVAAP